MQGTFETLTGTLVATLVVAPVVEYNSPWRGSSPKQLEQGFTGIYQLLRPPYYGVLP